MSAYYNEMEPYAAQWLRNLIAKGLIPDGEVDTRSILDVRPDDLRGFIQCHFFAGIAGWGHALRLAGWPDDREIWTGSCPCQPFSVAGAQKGQDDERHLWPVFFSLIEARRPAVVMGEQVAAAVGKDWLDGVFVDLEGIGYACGAAVVPACAVDAPHRRDRLWFVADAASERGDRRQDPAGQDWRACVEAGSEGFLADAVRAGWAERRPVAGSRSPAGDGGAYARGSLADAGLGRRGGSGEGESELARGAEAVGPGHRHVDDAERARLEGHAGHGDGRGGWSSEVGSAAAAGGALSDADGQRQPQWAQRYSDEDGGELASFGHNSQRPSAWRGYQWAIGADGKARRVKSGIRLLAHGVPARVGKLRALGNAIVPQVAAEVIAAYMDCRP